MTSDELESFLTDTGRKAVARFAEEAAQESDDFNIDEVIRQNHVDAMRDWGIADEIPYYADRVNAPLSPETVAALKVALESGSYARYKWHRAKQAKPDPWAAVSEALDGYSGLDEPTPEQAAAFELLRRGVMRDGRTLGEYLQEAGARGMPTEPGQPDDLDKLRARLDALRAEHENGGVDD